MLTTELCQNLDLVRYDRCDLLVLPLMEGNSHLLDGKRRVLVNLAKGTSRDDASKMVPTISDRPGHLLAKI